jgi:hypothetical protein
MITQETARQIYECYVEISRVEQYLKKNAPPSSTVDVVVKSYLNVPNNEDSSKTVFQIEQQVVENVIKTHYASLKNILVELNKMAKLECEMEENNAIEKN